jgi:hypothetical protein
VTSFQTSEISFPGCTTFRINPLISSEILKQIERSATTKFVLLILSESKITITQSAFERMSTVAESTEAGIIYSDYFDNDNNNLNPHPLIDYQAGSVPDSFNFGHILFLRKEILSKCINDPEECYRYSGLYSLRLNISLKYPIIRIPEFLYTAEKTGLNYNQFDYVDSKNRIVQVEMEQVFTKYLKRINAFIKQSFQELDLCSESFKNEVSVIIPVKNRVKTVSDAVNSALKQKTNFPFNVIVINNHSADGTTEALSVISQSNKNLINIIPDAKYHGIGGCWNEGINHDECGRFAIQLDSDDVYYDDNTLQKIVNVFRQEKCAMVIGSYKLSDFEFKPIPPEIIDHREWTAENGMNNALRINGFGAPRGFYTPVLRRNLFPDVSYGEDYAVGLALSRQYKVGRIFEPIYICRRWEGNSDSKLSVEKENYYNYYKDKIRTLEILIRQNLSAGEHV